MLPVVKSAHVKESPAAIPCAFRPAGEAVCVCVLVRSMDSVEPQISGKRCVWQRQLAARISESST
jgi:hypothetical protein